MRKIDAIHILIVNYNGLDLLKECVPSLLQAMSMSMRKTTLTIVDNASRDDSVRFLAENYPSVRIESRTVNKVLFAYNESLRKINDDVVILLNNDIRVDPHFIVPLVDPFERDDRIFAVGCKCLDFDGHGFQGEKSIGGLRGGMFWTDSRYEGFKEDINDSSWTLQVALGAFDRRKFLELGGYDELFFPGTWEDTDISFRAYRRGWHCLYQPRSIVFHKGQVTFHRVHSSKKRAIIAHRNSFLFLWKNFCCSKLMAIHWVWLLPRLLAALLKTDSEFMLGFLHAVPRLPQAVVNGVCANRGASRPIPQVMEIVGARNHQEGEPIDKGKLGVILIVKNEGKRIERCLKSVGFADQVVLIDSGSVDQTVDIAKSLNAHVFYRTFDDFSAQKNFALQKLETDWILSVDADEVVTDELKDEILHVIQNSNEISAYRIRRRTCFLRKWMSFTGMQDDRPIRLFRRGSGVFCQPIHEYLDIQGKVGVLKHHLLHLTTATIDEELKKTDFYTDLEAKYLERKGVSLSTLFILPRALAKFAYHYLWRFGFLDGREGFLFSYYAARYDYIKFKKINHLARLKRLEKPIMQIFENSETKLPYSIDRNDSRLTALRTAIGSVRHKNILEVGSGKGRFAQAIIEEGACVFGMDLSRNLLKNSRSFLGGRMAQASAVAIPFADYSFDVVYAVEVIEHLPELEGAVKEMIRVLKADGKLVIIDRNRYSLSQKRFLAPNLIIKYWHELKNDWFYPRGFVFRERWYSKSEVEKLLKKRCSNVKGVYVESDGEKKCGWHLIFDRVPMSRLFILWEGEKGRAGDWRPSKIYENL